MEQETKFYKNLWFWIALLLMIYTIVLQHRIGIYEKITDGYQLMFEAKDMLYEKCQNDSATFEDRATYWEGLYDTCEEFASDCMRLREPKSNT